VTTIPLDLDGYTDLPSGKIANVVTFLEMKSRPRSAPIRRADLSVRRVAAPGLNWYRSLYRRVGERWLWFSRAVMADETLRARLAAPATEVHSLEKSSATIGFAELSRAVPGEVEIAMFGVVPEVTGTGAARFLIETVLDRAWTPDVRRVWLHTCTFDHPAAIPFYLARGFSPWKYAIEVSDDPRLLGFLPAGAAPHVPVIAPMNGRGQRA
jgi:GNAT superfamily N-acetyltransferase